MSFEPPRTDPAPESELPIGSEPAKRFVTESALLEDAFRLAVQIANSGLRPTMIVGLWRGGSTVGIYVQECLQRLGIETDHIALRTSYRGLSSYREMVDHADSEIRVHGTQYLLETLNREDSLLIVDDVFGSGSTMHAVIRRLTSRLKRNSPHEIRSAVVWYKPAENRTGRPPDFHVNETDEWLVMPYELVGLAEHEIRANKPWLGPILDSLDLPEGES